MTRQVTVYKWQRHNGYGPYERVEVGKGIFHQFGMAYTEFENGPGSYTTAITAIVEMPDGSIISVQAELIRFEDKAGE